MAAHTPVIGLTAIVKSCTVEWRELGRGWGMRELVKDVANGPKSSGVTSGTSCVDAWRRSDRPEQLRFQHQAGDRRQVKVPTPSLAQPPRLHAGPHHPRHVALPQSQPRRPLLLPTRPHDTPARPLPVATTSSLCPESSSHPAPAVWALSEA